MPSNPERIILDAHCHTNASFDCLTSPENQVEAAARNGVGILIFADHVGHGRLDAEVFRNIENSFTRAQEYIKEHNLPLVLVPGAEITDPRNHIVLINVNYANLAQFMQKGDPFSPENLLPWASDNGSLAILAHPFPTFPGLTGSQLEFYASKHQLFGVEIHNGEFYRRFHRPLYDIWSAITERRLRRLGLQPMSNSDSHLPEHFGKFYNILTPTPENPVVDITTAFAAITDRRTAWKLHY